MSGASKLRSPSRTSTLPRIGEIATKETIRLSCGGQNLVAFRIGLVEGAQRVLEVIERVEYHKANYKVSPYAAPTPANYPHIR